MLYNFIIKDINAPFLFRKQFEQFDFAIQFLCELRKGGEGCKWVIPSKYLIEESETLRHVWDQSKVIKITSLTTGNKNDII